MYYFAYGSNLNKRQMRERCPDSKPMFIATLPNYKLVFVGWSRQWRGGVISIKPLRGERVRGAIYEVSEQCIQRLDKFEGHPTDYARQKVTVFDEDSEPIEAITYIKAGQFEETQPSKEYLAVIQQGYRDWRLF
ncbi:MAG TPA: gamma-glutamylcyclotransferase family protein [Dehalococcoidales bacterium]|nr:gamma-glutamylcyclotransferase family protein [Dehalococcoidales bacterium]